MGSRGGDRESEMLSEREREREMNIERIRSMMGQRRRSRRRRLVMGRRPVAEGAIWWPEPTSGEAGMVREVLLVCVLHNFIWCNILMCLFSIRGHK